MQDATASFSEYQELKDKKYTSILPPEGLGQVNIDVNLNNVTKDYPVTAKLTYNGGNGYGFKSEIEITYQGSSSMSYPKKNFSGFLSFKGQLYRCYAGKKRLYGACCRRCCLYTAV